MAPQFVATSFAQQSAELDYRKVIALLKEDRSALGDESYAILGYLNARRGKVSWPALAEELLEINAGSSKTGDGQILVRGMRVEPLGSSNLASRWMAEDFDAGLEWYWQIQKDSQMEGSRNQIIADVLSFGPGENQDKAVSWLQQVELKNEKNRDEMAYHLAENLARKPTQVPNDNMTRLLNLIADEEQRVGVVSLMIGPVGSRHRITLTHSVEVLDALIDNARLSQEESALLKETVANGIEP